MSMPIRIRRVAVEFLRPGPAHNQLLSPYTQYLAVCNDAGAAVVTVPYEQRVFERRLKELRYETGDQSDRLDMLHEIGRDMGRILESVPGFTGALMHDAGPAASLVHLRITLSAAELALLPFELAEVPVGSSACAVSIQTRPPVSITRHIRTVSAEGLVWPSKPRVLFSCGDPDAVPFEEHREKLVQAVRRFQYPDHDDAKQSEDGRRETFGDLLTILVNPTLVELQQECEANTYTHVHVLTHGDLDLVSRDLYGIVMRDEQQGTEVVSGERFVSAITRVGHRPSVVTIASCDSGNVGSVAMPGASFVHAVHQAGIPFVVGAQFPLSKDGSIPLTARLYEGLLWGEHPLHVLQQARAELHARYSSNWHDWASLVVYEALPADLDDQLDQLRYQQAKRAANSALESIDKACNRDTPREALRGLREAVTYAVERLPLDGRFGVDCIGLRASSRKRLAQAAFSLGRQSQGAAGGPFEDQYDLLDQARLDYARASRGLLVNDAHIAQNKATLHWVLVQLVSLSGTIGQSGGPGEWEAARLAAEHYRDHADVEERAWAHGSLAELWLLRMARPGLSEKERHECIASARSHTEELSRLYPGVDEFPIKSTRRQFERYTEWWGRKEFEDGLGRRGLKRSASWDGEQGLTSLAQQLVEILRRGRFVEQDETAPQSSPSHGGGGSPSPAAPPRKGAGRSAKPRGHTRGAAARTDLAGLAQPPVRSGGGPFFSVQALPAGHGDCLWIEYGDGTTTHRVLVDCGTLPTGKALLQRVDQVPSSERVLELFVLSHIDSDHIGGALPLFRAVKQGLQIGDVWFNGWKHISGQLGARQGEMFSTAIQDFELPWNKWREGKTILVADGALPEHVLPGGMKLTLLSPTRAQLDKLKPVWTRELKRYGLEPGGRVDYSRFLTGTPSTKADAAALTDIDGLADAKFGGDNGAPNGTSIALLAEYGGASALLAADAHAPVLVDSITRLLQARGARKLKIDLYKVSHHGSQNNVSSDLIQLLDCQRYLVSTNGDHFFHPDRQAIARIMKYGGPRKTIHFNYNNRLNDVWGDEVLAATREKYGCTTSYPPSDRPGTVVELL